MDNGTLFPTATGTPQGGVASPLLANIALHGLETTLVEQLSRRTGKTRSKVAPTVIRYADDFVVLDEDVSVIQQAKEITVAWLAGIGLELKPSKTTISHTLHHYQGNVGFHFLGFAVRQVRVGKTHTGCNTKGKPLGFKTIIMPGKAQVSKHLATLKDVIRRHKAAPQVALIQHLNPMIHGWANYYATVCSSRTFAKADHLLYLKLAAWARRRHRRKNLHWIARKYWHVEQGTWSFATSYGLRLARHNETPIKRHIKVAGRRSPYDGDWLYWATRMGHHPELPSRIATLLKRQAGRCQWCGLYFKAGDLPEIDHVIPTAHGGKDAYSNWQLLHRHCHDQKTAADTAAWRGAHDKSQRIEEPDEVKASCPVLKTSRGGDFPA